MFALRNYDSVNTPPTKSIVDMSERFLIACSCCENIIPGRRDDDGDAYPMGVKKCPECDGTEFEVVENTQESFDYSEPDSERLF